MKKVLITGATGNVGLEVIKALENIPHNLSIFAGVRDLIKDGEKLAKFEGKPVHFDFEDASTYPVLAKCDILFLLRPPQISDTEKYFKPLIASAKLYEVKNIIFLSVQGVEKSSIIPHHKIEKLIIKSGIPYTFLRPAYFMQNLTTTLHKDIINQEIFLPAGKAKFTLIDVRDIGKVAAKIITEIGSHVYSVYDLTCHERLTFQEMAEKLSIGLGKKISFVSPNLLQFIIRKRKEDVAFGYILVLIMLHYLPRFQDIPPVSDDVEKITGEKPIEFEQFVKDFREKLLGSCLSNV
jgi:uncharacterized protein YbjT (DUF2867 family)